MSTESHNKGYKEDIIDFFKNPIVIFSAPPLIALLTVLFNDRLLQIIAVVSVGAGYAVLGAFSALYKEKISRTMFSQVHRA